MTVELYAGIFIKTLPSAADLTKDPQSVHSGVVADRCVHTSAPVPGFCKLTNSGINDILKSDYCVCPFADAR